MKPPKLDRRIVALLLTVRDGQPPWFGPAAKGERDWCGAALCGPDEWVMCCEHVYTDAEISGMVAAGWIAIADELDCWNRFTTARQVRRSTRRCAPRRSSTGATMTVRSLPRNRNRTKSGQNS